MHPMTHHLCLVAVVVPIETRGPELPSSSLHIQPLLERQGDALHDEYVPLSRAKEALLRDRLADIAQGFPQPTRIFQVASLPALSNGKIDYASLARIPWFQDIQSATRESECEIAFGDSQATRPTCPVLIDVESGQATSQASAERQKSDDSPSCGPEAYISELEIVRVCAMALQCCSTRPPLEPCSSLLDFGATSLHIAVIAGMLHTSAARVSQLATPRAIARALQGDPEWTKAFFSDSHSVAGTARVPSGSHQSRKRLKADIQVGGRSVRDGSGYHQDDKCTPQWPSARSGDTVTLHVTSSNGEALTVAVDCADLPRRACTVKDDVLPECHASRQDFAIAELQACVDAPILLLRATSKAFSGDGNGQALRSTCDGTRTWVVSCSHAGDIWCLDVDPSSHSLATQQEDGAPMCIGMHLEAGHRPQSELTVWKTNVPSAPEGGLQIAGCGTTIAVACVDGNLYLTSLRSGHLLTVFQTGGQLRR
jgi:hypothetical protein